MFGVYFLYNAWKRQTATSPWWTHFQVVDVDFRVVQCIFCNKVVRRGKAGCLWRFAFGDVFFQWYNLIDIHFPPSSPPSLISLISPLFTSTACCATSCAFPTLLCATCYVLCATLCAFPALHQHRYVRQHLAIRVHHLLCGAQVHQKKEKSTKTEKK